jgi:ABC-2 type transport system ATP-binding protein
VTAVIQAEKLTKFYGQHRGIVEVDMEVGEGEAFGFLGPNGAGKTTMIRTLLDHIRPTSGRAMVFGIETTADPVAIHRRLGYLPGEFALYDKLTGGQTLEYFANLHGGVDRLYQQDLIARLDVDPSRKFREYSKGNKQKIGLIIALQHRPELLLLDEPTSGLDPLIQQEFYGVIREAKAEGRTVFLSSHILSEVEKSCDRVAIIRDGRLARVDRTEALRDIAHHQVELVFADAAPVPEAEFAALPGVSDVTAQDRVLRMRVSGSIAPVVRAAAKYELADFVSREPSLEETFLAEYERDTDRPELTEAAAR